MIQIYRPDNTDFEHNGNMALLPSSAIVHAILNGSWEAELEHPIDEMGRWRFIEDEAVVKMPSFNGSQMFRVIKKEKTDSGITAYMRPIFMDAKDDCFLLDVRPTEKNGQEALNIMTAPNSKYAASSNITVYSTAYYENKNLIEALNGDDDNAFVNRWGGEIIYDNYNVIVNERAGSDHGVEIRYGKNIPQDGFSEEIDLQNVVTRIVPQAFNGYMIEGESPWVDSPLINNYPTIKYGVITFDDVKMREDAQDGDEEEGIIVCDSQEELEAALIQKCEEQYASGLDKPAVTISADMVLLENTDLYQDVKELEKVSLGDDVHCRHTRLNITTDARVIELEWDCILNAPSSVVIGDFQYNYIDDVESTISRVESAIRSDGTVIGQQVQGIIDGVRTQMRAQSSVAKKTNVRSVLFEDLDPNSETYGAMCLGTMGFQIANVRTSDGRDWDWRTFGTGSGFFADFIVSGTMLADRISGGTLILGGNNNGNGVARVVDAEGNEVVRLDKDGVYARGSYICAATSGLDKRIELRDGSVGLSDRNGENPVFLEYRSGGGIIIRSGGEATDATGSKTLMIISDSSVTFMQDELWMGGRQGKTGTAEFSDGTHLEFKNGILVGGNTSGGSF